MNKTVENVTKLYERALAESQKFQPGKQPNIEDLMRSAYMHGYVAGWRDRDQSQSGDDHGLS